MPDRSLHSLLSTRESVHFDLDRVLLDSNELKVRCMVDAIAGLGPQIVAPFVDEFRVSFGRSRFEHFRRLYAHHLGGDELGWEDFYAVYGGAYGALVRARYGDAPLCAHASTLVRSLAAAGVPMTIVTGTPTAEAEAILRVHHLDGAFAAILGGEQHKAVRVREALTLTGSSRAGAEISIDGAVVDGRYVPMFVARKQLSEHPYFQETGHVVDAADELQRDPQLMEMLRAAHVALGLRRGMTHSEVRLTSGGPRIVEINARLGGDLIPYVGMLATGIDPARVAVDVVLGREPDVRMTEAKAAEIRFFYPTEDSIVRDVELPRAVGGLHLAEATAREGAILRLPPRGYLARYAQLICVADDGDAARAAADEASAGVTLRYDRAPRFQGDRPDLSWIDAAIPAAA